MTALATSLGEEYPGSFFWRRLSTITVPTINALVLFSLVFASSTRQACACLEVFLHFVEHVRDDDSFDISLLPRELLLQVLVAVDESDDRGEGSNDSDEGGILTNEGGRCW